MQGFRQKGKHKLGRRCLEEICAAANSKKGTEWHRKKVTPPIVDDNRSNEQKRGARKTLLALVREGSISSRGRVRK